jgi:hypothetical protein
MQVGINGVQDSLRLLPDDTGGPARTQQRSAAHNNNNMTTTCVTTTCDATRRPRGHGGARRW